MPAFNKTWLSGAAAMAAMALLAFAHVAHAQLRAGNCGCKPPPPPPPSCGTCSSGGTTVNVTVNANSQSQSQSHTGALGSAIIGGGGGGGGGVWVEQAPAANVVQGLNVDTGEAEVKRVSYQATRKVERRVLIQASCLDDKGAPHPASQVHPERDVADDYDGEIFRCIAGTRLQATIGDYNDGMTLAKGETLACDKMQALHHAPGGAVTCQAQKPARDCNERSLLRRYGPGVKALKLVREETYTATREEQTARTTATASMITLDGGVGGFR